MARNRDPRTKEELFDRMLSFDFDGDIRNLGEEQARLRRLAPNRLELFFPASGRVYELAVKIPRDQPYAHRGAEARSFAGRSNEPELPEVEMDATLKEQDRQRERAPSRRSTRRREEGGARQ